jgi:hypothetical protein
MSRRDAGWRPHTDKYEHYIHGGEVFLNKLTVTQLFKKFPVSYHTKMFINVLRRPQQSIPHKQMKEVHILASYFCKFHFNLTLPLTEEDKIMETLGNIRIKLFVLAALKEH